ncbi:hypothetical protein CFP56_037175 [Quercus suber]|uniref:Uncharacterized protein n=1 Tax=Quercus suber TaxID=58331 RepID=A0AAW0LNB5_QUESU
MGNDMLGFMEEPERGLAWWEEAPWVYNCEKLRETIGGFPIRQSQQAHNVESLLVWLEECPSQVAHACAKDVSSFQRSEQKTHNGVNVMRQDKRVYI